MAELRRMGEGKKKKQCGGRLSGDVCKSGDICLGWRDAPLFVVSGAYDGVYCEVCVRVLGSEAER